MTIRMLIEVLCELERATTESSPDDGSDRPASDPVIRELDHRRGDGIDVWLLWNQAEARVLLAVSDAKTGDAFDLEVEPQRAPEAFYHPYSYATSKGGVHHPLAV